MKVVKIGKDKIITPWLTAEEAAVYCAMSPSTFNRRRHKEKLPVGNFGGNPRFYSPVLDEWMKGKADNGCS